jgi:hypothetical protein
MQMELSHFLIQAKLSTYANEAGAIENVLEDGFKELEYTEEQYRYRDRYFGSNPFIGEELVWENGRLVWGMNYFGKALEDAIPVSQVYSFLKQALRLAHPDRPFRGPDYFRAGSFTYVDKSNGTVDAFTGEEMIYFRDQQVYCLVYHGGRIA